MASLLEQFWSGGQVVYRGWPAGWWLAGLGAAVAIVAAAYVMQRAGGGIWIKRLSYGLRLMACMLLLFLLMEPVLRAEEVLPQQSFLIHLFDTSGSMGIEDFEGQGRLAAVNGLTRDSEARGELDRLYRPLEFGFDVDLQTRAAGDALDVTESTTDLASAFQQLHVQTSGLPLSGVVLYTDGMATINARQEQIVEAALALNAPIYAVGSAPKEPGPDIWIEDVMHPAQAVKGSATPVTVLVGVRDMKGGATVTLYQDATKVEEKILRPKSGEQTISAEFQLSINDTGTNAYRAEVTTDNRETYPWNNSETFFINVVQERQRLLYVEGYPRYEYRSLRAAFENDERFQVTSYVMVDRQDNIYRQGLNTAGELEQGFPKTEAELFAYDVVVIGDVEAAKFTTDQLTNLREFVRRKGGGLLFLAGDSSFAPGGFNVTPLADVLPFSVGNTQRLTEEFRVSPTQEGIERGIFGPLNTASGSAPWEVLPPVKGLFPLQGLKPGAVALCRIDQGRGEEDPPVVAFQRYGGGVSLICGVSGTWPWRFQTNSDNPSYNAFWKQMSLILSDRLNNRLNVTAEPALAPVGSEVKLSVVARNAAFEMDPVAKITLEITTPDGTVSSFAPQPSADGGPGTYDYTLTGTGAGLHKIRAFTTPVPDDQAQEASGVFVVEDDSPELRSVELNEGLLRQLASATGGDYVHALDYDQLPKMVKPAEGSLTQVRETAIWDKPAFLIGLLALLLSEWTIRRWGNLA